jgi:hypothetical protein
VAEVLVREETMAGREIESWVLPGLPERITARELLRLRVRDEVARRTDPGPVDGTSEADEACTAFERNGLVMICGERQVDRLDDVIDLRAGSAVAFVRLVPLVGG